MNRERRALPWVKVDKEYVFDGPSGRQTLAELRREPEWAGECLAEE